MAVIRRERPVVLTGRSAAVFLKNKRDNEKKVQRQLELCEKQAQEKGKKA